MAKRASTPGGGGGAVRVAETRADILSMITRLKRSDSPPPRPSPRHTERSTKPVRNGYGAETSTPARAHPPEGASLTGLMVAIHRLESRLLHIESALGQRDAAASERESPLKDATFSGLIKGQMLSDMLQLVSSNSMSGIFVIENDITSCTLYFDEGRICHAASGDVTGEEAFFTAFALQSGRYHFKEMAQLPPERTISAGTQFLVLEALRRMDEKNA